MSPKKKNRKKASSGSKRLSFPEDEKKYTWLGLLLEGYHIVDRGVSSAIAAERKKGRTLACAKGCASCCVTHADIPVYPLEIVGIAWYVTYKMTGSPREKLKHQLASYKKGDPCPFLVDRACSIHQVRPMACRQFNVFDKQCDIGEDPFHTRRQDVMDPVKKYVDQAFMVMLPYYGVESEQEKIRTVETGSFHNMVKELQSCNWKELAEKMERADRA